MLIEYFFASLYIPEAVLRILFVTLMRIQIRFVTLIRFGSYLSLCCGSGSKLPNKDSKPWKSAQIGSYSLHFGSSSANWCGSGTSLLLWCGFVNRCGSGSSLSLLCGSGSRSSLKQWKKFLNPRLFTSRKVFKLVYYTRIQYWVGAFLHQNRNDKANLGSSVLARFLK